MSAVDQILADPPEVSPRGHYRTARREATRALRPARTPAAALVAAVVAFVAWAAFAALAGGLLGHPLDVPYATRILSVTWAHPIVRAAAGTMVAVGVVLVMIAIVPGRCRLVPLETTDPHLVMGLSRTGLRRTLASAVRAVPGVDGVSVRFSRRQIEIVAVTDAQRTGDLLPEIGSAAGERLSGLGVLCRHEVVVRLRRRRV